MRKFFILIGLAALAAGCLRVQSRPDGRNVYGGIVTPSDAAELENSAAIADTLRAARRNGQPVSATSDGRGGKSVQVGYSYSYGDLYPGIYAVDPHFAASAARSAQVWAEQLAAEQPVPIEINREAAVVRRGDLEPRVRTLEVEARAINKVIRKKAAAKAKPSVP